VVNVSFISIRFGLKVENHTQYLHIYLLYVGNNLKPVPIFRVFTQSGHEAALYTWILSDCFWILFCTQLHF